MFMAIIFALALAPLAPPKSPATSPIKGASATMPEDESRLEMAIRRRGSMITKRFYPVGEAEGLGSVSVSAVVVYEGVAGKTIKGLSITVKGTNRYDSGSSSFIDWDEMDSLIQALDYMIKESKGWTINGESSIEAEFKGRSGFQVGLILGSDMKFNSYFRSGTSTAYPSGATIDQFRVMVSKAKEFLATK